LADTQLTCDRKTKSKRYQQAQALADFLLAESQQLMALLALSFASSSLPLSWQAAALRWCSAHARCSLAAALWALLIAVFVFVFVFVFVMRVTLIEFG
jgi:hypothetical protein